MSVWDLNLSLSAYKEKRAIPRAGRQLSRFGDNLLVVCPLSMAGEDPSVHAVLIGSRGAAPQLLAAPDPRSPRSRLEMFSRMRAVLEPYFESCLEQEGSLPQIMVPSESARDVLLGLADWLPYLKDSDGGKMQAWTEDARRLGMLLKLYSQRSDLPGQQLLLVASQTLADHFAFGQDTRGHLGAQLAWVDTPDGEDVFVSAVQAEAEPMGARTDARMDIEKLNPALEGWSKVERGGSRSLASFRRQEIEDILREVLEPIWHSTCKVIEATESLGLQELGAVEHFWERDRYSFEEHMNHMQEGGRFSRRDSVRSATYALAEAEDALQQLEASRLWEDPLRLAQARVEGEVLCGINRNLPSSEGDFVAVDSEQRWLTVRVGDTLECMQRECRGVVREIRREADRTTVLLAVSALPEDGATSDWAPGRPDWFRLARERRNIARALAEMPSTHAEESGEGAAPGVPGWDPSDPDPLEALEALR